MASRVQYGFSSLSPANPAAITFAAEPTEGNLLVACVAHRQPSGATNGAFTYSPGTWTQRVGVDHELTNTDTSLVCAVATKIAGASDGTSFSFDNGTADAIWAYVAEYALDAGETWTYATGAIASASAPGGSLAVGPVSAYTGAGFLFIPTLAARIFGNCAMTALGSVVAANEVWESRRDTGRVRLGGGYVDTSVAEDEDTLSWTLDGSASVPSAASAFIVMRLNVDTVLAAGNEDLAAALSITGDVEWEIGAVTASVSGDCEPFAAGLAVTGDVEWELGHAIAGTLDLAAGLAVTGDVEWELGNNLDGAGEPFAAGLAITGDVEWEIGAVPAGDGAPFAAGLAVTGDVTWSTIADVPASVSGDCEPFAAGLAVTGDVEWEIGAVPAGDGAPFAAGLAITGDVTWSDIADVPAAGPGGWLPRKGTRRVYREPRDATIELVDEPKPAPVEGSYRDRAAEQSKTLLAQAFAEAKARSEARTAERTAAERERKARLLEEARLERELVAALRRAELDAHEEELARNRRRREEEALLLLLLY